MNDTAIAAEGLSKRFRKGVDYKGRLFSWLSQSKLHEYFWALKNVSFEVKKGEMLGIIGPNGAGKSTLLRILSRITRPNEGYAHVFGRVGSLLTVGTGFHPELTGRENIFLNGTLLGMNKSAIASKFDEIIEFSGIEEFLDTPLKRFSSGMQVRLGFSIAAHLMQEIMLVDEVLAVGDAAFREKCIQRMDEATAEGRTVLFVGHNLSVISTTCDRVIWLDHGHIKRDGPSAEVIQEYVDLTTKEESRADGYFDLREKPDHRDVHVLRLTYLQLLDERERPVPHVQCGQQATLDLGYELIEPGEGSDDLQISLSFLNLNQHPVAMCHNRCSGGSFKNLPPKGIFRCTFDKFPLMPGQYKIDLKCHVDSKLAQHISHAADLRVDEGTFYASEKLPPPGSGDVLLEYGWSLEG